MLTRVLSLHDVFLRNVFYFVRPCVFILFQDLVEADTKGNGSVTRSALHQIINTNGLQISGHQMNQVWNTLPLNEDGTIQYKDFLSLYANTRNTPRRNGSRASNGRTQHKVRS